MSCIAEKTCTKCGIKNAMGPSGKYNDDKTIVYAGGACLCGLFECKHCGGNLKAPDWWIEDALKQSRVMWNWGESPTPSLNSIYKGLGINFKEDYQI